MDQSLFKSTPGFWPVFPLLLMIQLQNNNYFISSHPVKTHNLSSLHTILSTGSPLKPASYDYVYKSIKADVLLGSISGEWIVVFLHDKHKCRPLKQMLVHLLHWLCNSLLLKHKFAHRRRCFMSKGGSCALSQKIVMTLLGTSHVVHFVFLMHMRKKLLLSLKGHGCTVLLVNWFQWGFMHLQVGRISYRVLPVKTQLFRCIAVKFKHVTLEWPLKAGMTKVRQVYLFS